MKQFAWSTINILPWIIWILNILTIGLRHEYSSRVLFIDQDKIVILLTMSDKT